MPVGEVAAVGEVHAQDGVARLEGGHEDRHVGLGPRVRLDVGVVGAEELLQARQGEALHHVGVLAPAVVAPPRVAFRVLVGEDGAHGLEHGFGHEVLRGDELELMPLAEGLGPYGVGHLGIGAGEVLHGR
jgi:hypothetical protein